MKCARVNEKYSGASTHLSVRMEDPNVTLLQGVNECKFLQCVFDTSKDKTPLLLDLFGETLWDVSVNFGVLPWGENMMDC